MDTGNTITKGTTTMTTATAAPTHAKAALRRDLINAYHEYRIEHDRNRSPYSTPTTQQEAGCHLRAADPLASFATMAPEDWEDVSYWAEVRSLIVAAMNA